MRSEDCARAGKFCSLYYFVSDAHKAKNRSLFVNLKDKSLTERVFSGEIPGEWIPTKTSEDMVSEERKVADLKIKDQFLQFPWSGGETDAFQCESRCRQVRISSFFERHSFLIPSLGKMLLYTTVDSQCWRVYDRTCTSPPHRL